MYVFVYGTLKSGHGNNVVLGDSQFIGRGVTVPAFFMKTTGFPVVFKRGPVSANVEGEIYKVISPRIQANLDRLEGVPDMYTREHCIVDCDAVQDQLDCAIYIGNPEYWGDLSRLRDVPVSARGTYVWSR